MNNQNNYRPITNLQRPKSPWRFDVFATSDIAADQEALYSCLSDYMVTMYQENLPKVKWQRLVYELKEAFHLPNAQRVNRGTIVANKNKSLLNRYTKGIFESLFHEATGNHYNVIEHIGNKIRRLYAEGKHYFPGLLICSIGANGKVVYGDSYKNRDTAVNVHIPGGSCDINDRMMSFSFVTITRSYTTATEQKCRFPVLFIDAQVTSALHTYAREKKDTVRRLFSKIRQIGNHDRYHQLINFESTWLYSEMIDDYASSYEVHSARTHADIAKLLFQKFPAKKQELLHDARFFIKLIYELDIMQKDKEYLLLVYFYLFFRIIDPLDPMVQDIKNVTTQQYNIDITDIFCRNTGRNSKRPMEKKLQEYVHIKKAPLYVLDRATEKEKPYPYHVLCSL